MGTIIAFLLVFLYSYLGYKGIFQSGILLPEFLLESENHSLGEFEERSNTEAPIEEKKARQLDVLNTEEIENLKINLYQLFEDNKIHLNESLRLTDLSSELDISSKKLSELLNAHLGISFYDLINEYRVKEVQQRIKADSSDKYTLIAIANDSGFQSKSSFNRIFKQKTGMSPSKYRESTREEFQG